MFGRKRPKRFAAVLALWLAAAVCSLPVAAFEGGNGSAGQPYQIATQADLYFAAQAPDKDYILLNDITVDSLDGMQPIGTADVPFTGTFNGNGHHIEIRSNFSGDGTGLFGKIGTGGVVENLQVSRYSNQDGTQNCGIIADINEGTVRSCFSEGSVTGNNNVGGLVGLNTGTIENCYSEASVTCKDNSGGGFVGYSEGGTIKNCYTSSSVQGNNACGGFIGTNKASTLTNCFYNSQNGSIIGTGMGSDAVAGKSWAQLRSAATYSGWDFGNVWTIVEGMDTPYLTAFVGKGTIENPYKIHNASEFRALTSLGAGDAGKGKYFSLAADLTLQGTGASVSVDAPFQGVFDGNGYWINGAYSSSGSISVDSYNGLFPVVGESAVIKNVTVTNIRLTGSGVGIIAGKNSGRIENCVVDGTISASKDAGGIVGENAYGTVINCRSTVNVSSSSTGAGGIVGYNNNGRIENCHSSGSVSARAHGVGGIVGDNSSGTVQNCYATGSVSGNSDEVGGVAGRLYGGSITNCYASTTLYGNATVGGIVGNRIESGDISQCYFNQDKAGRNVAVGSSETEEFGLSAEQMKNSGSFAGWDFSTVWQLSSLYEYPTLRSLYGSGTQDDPYKLRNAGDFSVIKNTGLQSAGRKNYYIVENNFDTNSIQIGSGENPFIGSINGAGHTLRNIAPLFNAIGPGGYVGNLHLKGGRIAYTLTDATVEHCTVVNDRLAVTNQGGTISNCIVYTNHSDSNNAGKFVNQNLEGGKIKNCGVISLGISSSGIGLNSGGFVGNNNNAAIENCFSIGTVAGGTNVGGFAGRNDNNGKIINCYSVGEVHGENYVGGFVGLNYATIQNCYAIGAVVLPESTEDAVTAGFAAVNEGTMTNVYYNNEINTLPDAAAAGLTTADGKKQASYAGFSFGGNPWSISEDISTPYLSFATGGRHMSVKDTTTTPPTPPETGGLTDISGHWAETTIRDLVKRGIVNGYEDGTYQPDNPVSKAEFIKLFCQTMKLSKPASDIPYEDVRTSWARDYIGTVYAMGLTENLNADDTTFGVDDAITRAQAATLMGRLVAPGYSGTTSFTDNDQIPQWAQGPVAATVSKGLIQGNPDGSFAPANGLTRAEAATIIARLLN